MNWRTRWWIVGLVALMWLMGCDETSPDQVSSETSDPSLASREPRYSDAELARRQAAINLYDSIHDWKEIQADQPVTELTFSPAMTEEQVRQTLSPFLGEVEALTFAGTPLAPEFIHYFTRMPRLEKLEFHHMELVASDFSGIDLRHVESITMYPERDSAKLWAVPEQQFRFTHWATSEDGKMSVRLFVESAPQPVDQPMWFGVELRNNTDQALYIHSGRRKQSLQEARGPDGVLAYVPSEPDWVDESRTSAWMPKPIPNILVHAQATHREEFRLPQENWPGTDEPGSYTVNYQYRSTIGEKVMEKVAQDHRVDVDALEIWNGETPDLSITIESNGSPRMQRMIQFPE